MRYSFLNMYGERVAIEDTDSLREALADAKNFECAIYDNELEMLAYAIDPREERFRWNERWVLAMAERSQCNEGKN